MKVEYIKGYATGYWYWRAGPAESSKGYTRRSDAVRGFERFCAAIKGVK